MLRFGLAVLVLEFVSLTGEVSDCVLGFAESDEGAFQGVRQRDWCG
jgi:hypothetical protein